MANIDPSQPYSNWDKEGSNSKILGEGSYMATVTKCIKGVSKGNKTKGAVNLQLQLELRNNKGELGKSTAFLIFHDSCIWKAVTFFKATGLAPEDAKEGIAFDIAGIIPGHTQVCVKVSCIKKTIKDQTSGIPKDILINEVEKFIYPSKIPTNVGEEISPPLTIAYDNQQASPIPPNPGAEQFGGMPQTSGF